MVQPWVNHGTAGQFSSGRFRIQEYQSNLGGQSKQQRKLCKGASQGARKEDCGFDEAPKKSILQQHMQLRCTIHQNLVSATEMNEILLGCSQQQVPDKFPIEPNEVPS